MVISVILFIVLLVHFTIFCALVHRRAAREHTVFRWHATELKY